MVTKTYHHLQYDARCQISALLKSGMTQSAIANQLSVHRSTISRELKRNKGKRGYRHNQANMIAIDRRKMANYEQCKMKGETLAIADSIPKCNNCHIKSGPCKRLQRCHKFQYFSRP